MTKHSTFVHPWLVRRKPWINDVCIFYIVFLHICFINTNSQKFCYCCQRVLESSLFQVLKVECRILWRTCSSMHVTTCHQYLQSMFWPVICRACSIIAACSITSQRNCWRLSQHCEQQSVTSVAFEKWCLSWSSVCGVWSNSTQKPGWFLGNLSLCQSFFCSTTRVPSGDLCSSVSSQSDTVV